MARAAGVGFETRKAPIMESDCVPPTQRSDGTWRKAIRVRKGFDPSRVCDPFAPSSSRFQDDSDEDTEQMAGKHEQASRSSGGANDAQSSSTTAESSEDNVARGAATGKEEENHLKKAFITGPLDPYASCCSFTKADEFDVFSATVASNVANEDRILVDPVCYQVQLLSFQIINTSQQARGLFGVFDGHGGKDVASFALERIGPLFDKQYSKKSKGDADDVISLFFEAAGPAPKQKKAAAEGGSKVDSGDDPGAALKRAFVEIDEEFLNQHGRRLPTTGSCGLVCYIERGIVWSAIVGDSRS
jgi:hypothetical protein